MGGRRVVRVRDVTDAATDPVQTLLKMRAPALVVLEGPTIQSRSKLRTVLEAAADGVAIGCYPEEGRALEETIRETLRANGVGVEPDALSWLSQQLGADRASTRAELEKLALYVGPGNRVDLEAAMTCVGDLAGLSLDDALFAATTGDVATADRALEAAIAEGAAPVQVLARRARALTAVAPGKAGDGGARADGGRCGEGAAAAGFLSKGRGVHPLAGAVAVRDSNGGDSGIGRGGTRLQTNGVAGSGSVPERGADVGAALGGDVSFYAILVQK